MIFALRSYQGFKKAIIAECSLRESVMAIRSILKKYQIEIVFLLFIYVISLYFRLIPRLSLSPDLMGFLGDAWYRIAMGEYFKIHGALPDFSIRYQPYGWVPMFYSPGAPVFFAYLSGIFNCSIPVVCTRIIPFFEALTPLSFYFLAKYLFGRKAAIFSTFILAITPAFIVWTGVTDPISITFFIFPIIILLFIKHCKGLHEDEMTLFKRLLNVILIGFMFALIFIFHQSYFLIMPIYFSLSIYLAIIFKSKMHILLDSVFIVVLSLLMTMPWWKPDNLFFWWFRCLTTPGHSQYPGFITQCRWYGSYMAYFSLVVSFLYILYVLYLLITKSPILKTWRVLIPLALILAPLYGLFAQKICIILGITDKAILESNIIRPLRADRFHVFLAQPIALIIGVIFMKLEKEIWDRVKNRGIIKYFVLIVLIAFGGLFLYKVISKDLPQAVYRRFKWVPFTQYEHLAAEWFKENSGPNGRIIADYHRAQMFSGVVGGKALLGLPLPLKGSLKLPYSNRSGKYNTQIKNDVRVIYSSDDAFQTKKLMDRYGCTHVLISKGLRQSGFFSGSGNTGMAINEKKFDNVDFFEKVYDYANVKLYKLKNPLEIYDDHTVKNLALWAKPIGGSQTGEILNIEKINDNSLGDNYVYNAARTHPAIEGNSVWAWFGLDFGKEVVINRIKAYPAVFIYPEEYEGKGVRTYMAKSYVLQYYDGSKWIDIPNTVIENNESRMIEFNFKSILTQKIRIYIHKEYDDIGTQSKENHYRAACLELSAFNIKTK